MKTSSTGRDDGLVRQLALLLEMAGARPRTWAAGVVAASVVLALLDTAGVAAMIPLMQLVSGADTESGALAVIADLAGTTDPAALIPIVALGIAVLFILKSVAAMAFRWWMLGRTSQVSALVGTELMHRYLLAPYAAHRQRQLSEVYRNIGEASTQGASVLMTTLSIVTDSLTLIAIVMVLAFTSPLVTLMTVVLFGAGVLGLQLSLRRMQSRIGEESAESNLQAWSYMMPALDGFREARLTSSTQVFVDGFRKAKLRNAEASRKLAIVSELPRYALEIGFVIMIAGISLLLFASGNSTQALTVLGVFAAASLRGLPTLNRIAGSLAIVRAGRVGLRIVTESVAQLDAEGRHDETPGRSAPVRGDIVLKDLVYKFPDSDVPVLDGISLRIPMNTTTAFVGASGAGKSTLLDVILGLLEPDSGSIECGGRPIDQDLTGWYSGLGVVPQDVFVINASLEANVAFGIPSNDIDRERVREVLAIARLDGMLQSLPAGLKTLLGERGTRLSGGQRQRLGLARALYRRPSILVLDEATSALDNETEREITEALAGLAGNLTILIVAHRLSTVRDADNLVFLKDGHLEAQGTFAELRQTSADFARLVALGELR